MQEAHSRDGIFGFVAAGLGVTLCTDVALDGARRGVVVVPLEDVEEQVEVIAAWRSVSMTPTLPRFLELVGPGQHL